MKKVVFSLFASLLLIGGNVFAQNILPDSAQISVKSPIIQGEATNLEITIMKNGSTMTSYTGMIFMMLTTENGSMVAQNEYTLPNNGTYRFASSDLGSKEFQKGLEIKKEGTFYLEVSDLDSDADDVLGRQQITVVRGDGGYGESHIEILNPIQDSILTSEKVEILAQATDLRNSNILVYIDDNLTSTTITDSDGLINYVVPNIEPGRHSLRLECPDIEGNILGTSDKIYFTFTPQETEGFKSITVEPEDSLKVGDLVDITVYTDEMVESVKMRLSDRSENDGIILSKDENGVFSQRVFLLQAGTVSISIDTSSANNTSVKSYENVKEILVSGAPEISNITTDIDQENQTATVTWNVLNGPAPSYLVNFGLDEFDLSQEQRTSTESLTFTQVPYDTVFYFQITPYRDELTKHGAASKTIQFLIEKPAEVTPTDDTPTTGASTTLSEFTSTEPEPSQPKCTVQNISTRTTKIGDNYYLIRDKVENVSKYIVYSSTSPSISTRVKVYETTDTSYEYPFDHTAEEEQFMYYWIDGICDDGEELQLSGATKVQVGPATNFFLLICLTLLIYFGIKIFRQTED